LEDNILWGMRRVSSGSEGSQVQTKSATGLTAALCIGFGA
jgi:hypothetical protein